MGEKNSNNRGIFLLLLFLSAIAAGVILKWTATVVLPVVVSVLLSLVFYPIIKRLNEKLKFPWWLAILVVFVVFFAIFISIANILTSGITSILESLPAYEERLNTIYARLAEEFNIEVDTDMTFVENMWSHISIRNTVGKYALSFTNGVYQFSRNLLLVVLFSVFFLAEMNSTKEKVRLAFHEDDETDPEESDGNENGSTPAAAKSRSSVYEYRLSNGFSFPPNKLRWPPKQPTD